ncbi:MAG: metallophosphatase [Flavobacteriia bacterium]|nr:metallophosphatase [Flavobacteriia bacterium]
MGRRKFIKNIGLTIGGIFITPSLFAQSNFSTRKKYLTILHTNDTHSNIDPFPTNHPEFPNQGGISKRFALIQKIRNETQNVLLLDAGDIFQGTPYFNKYGGVLEMKLMTELAYDVATLGNHDFDGGLEGFKKAKKQAKFPFVNSNYDFSETILKDDFLNDIIIEKDGLKIGIFGIGIELKGLVPDDKYGKTKYLDPIMRANETAKKLKTQNCDYIICLSHLGFEYANDKISDKVLAQKTKNIDLIIGGHTHTFLKEPYIIENLENEKVMINQVGWGGLYLGRIDLEFSKKNKNIFMKNIKI